MSKRLQMILTEPEYREIQHVAPGAPAGVLDPLFFLFSLFHFLPPHLSNGSNPACAKCWSCVNAA